MILIYLFILMKKTKITTVFSHDYFLSIQKSTNRFKFKMLISTIEAKIKKFKKTEFIDTFIILLHREFG